MSAPIDLVRLLPHGPPLRLLTRVEEVAEGRVRATGRIPASAPGVADGAAPALLGVELGAQSTAMFAAAAVAAESDDPRPRVGYLVSLRSVTLRAPFLPIDTDLTVEARHVGGAGGLEMFRFAVCLAGESEPRVEGTVGTMLTDRVLEPAT